MTIPTREEINVHDSLDERVACEHFLGKDLKAAEKMFRKCPGRYEESLGYMGPVAFRYYVQAEIRYLRSKSAGRGTIGSFYCTLLLHTAVSIGV